MNMSRDFVTQIYATRDGKLVLVDVLCVHNQKFADVVGKSGSCVGTKWTTDIFDLHLLEVPILKKDDPRNRLPRMTSVCDEGLQGYIPYSSKKRKKIQKTSRGDCEFDNLKENRRPEVLCSVQEVSINKREVGSRKKLLVANGKYVPYSRETKKAEGDIPCLNVTVQLSAEDRATAEIYITETQNSDKFLLPVTFRNDIRDQLLAEDCVVPERHLGKSKESKIALSTGYSAVTERHVEKRNNMRADFMLPSRKAPTETFSRMTTNDYDVAKRCVENNQDIKVALSTEGPVISDRSISKSLAKKDRHVVKRRKMASLPSGDFSIADRYIDKNRVIRVALSDNDRVIADMHVCKDEDNEVALSAEEYAIAKRCVDKAEGAELALSTLDSAIVESHSGNSQLDQISSSSKDSTISEINAVITKDIRVTLSAEVRAIAESHFDYSLGTEKALKTAQLQSVALIRENCGISEHFADKIRGGVSQITSSCEREIIVQLTDKTREITSYQATLRMVNGIAQIPLFRKQDIKVQMSLEELMLAECHRPVYVHLLDITTQ